jgi:hypothetical protein
MKSKLLIATNLTIEIVSTNLARVLHPKLLAIQLHLIFSKYHLLLLLKLMA